MTELELKLTKANQISKEIDDLKEFIRVLKQRSFSKDNVFRYSVGIVRTTTYTIKSCKAFMYDGTQIEIPASMDSKLMGWAEESLAELESRLGVLMGG